MMLSLPTRISHPTLLLERHVHSAPGLLQSKGPLYIPLIEGALSDRVRGSGKEGRVFLLSWASPRQPIKRVKRSRLNALERLRRKEETAEPARKESTAKVCGDSEVVSFPTRSRARARASQHPCQAQRPGFKLRLT